MPIGRGEKRPYGKSWPVRSSLWGKKGRRRKIRAHHAQTENAWKTTSNRPNAWKNNPNVTHRMVSGKAHVRVMQEKGSAHVLQTT